MMIQLSHSYERRCQELTIPALYSESPRLISPPGEL